jgi:hypothetical protein
VPLSICHQPAWRTSTQEHIAKSVPLRTLKDRYLDVFEPLLEKEANANAMRGTGQVRRVFKADTHERYYVKMVQRRYERRMLGCTRK